MTIISKTFAAAALATAVLAAPLAASAATTNDALIGAGAATGPSSAPEPSTWAMLLMGFGGAGALLRRRGGAVYRLVEALPTGEEIAEEFAAPDDATALRRAALVAEGQIQLWRGDVRIAPVMNA